MCDCACICCSPGHGPKAKRAIVVAIPAFVLAIFGCLTGLVAHRLYGIFALAGSAVGVVACLIVLCASADFFTKSTKWKSAGSASFVSAAVCLGGIVMLIYSLIGLPTYYNRCLVEHCSGEKWSYLAEELVPSWQLQICDDPCEGRTSICLTDLLGRDCASEEDCLEDSRSSEYCTAKTQELLNARVPAYTGARPAKHPRSARTRTASRRLSNGSPLTHTPPSSVRTLLFSQRWLSL